VQTIIDGEVPTWSWLFFLKGSERASSGRDCFLPPPALGVLF